MKPTVWTEAQAMAALGKDPVFLELTNAYTEAEERVSVASDRLDRTAFDDPLASEIQDAYECARAELDAIWVTYERISDEVSWSRRLARSGDGWKAVLEMVIVNRHLQVYSLTITGPGLMKARWERPNRYSDHAAFKIIKLAESWVPGSGPAFEARSTTPRKIEAWAFLKAAACATRS